MMTPTTEDIVVLRELIEDAELDPRKDCINDLLELFGQAKARMAKADNALTWALSNCGITRSHFLEPTLELIATQSAREHARLGRK